MTDSARRAKSTTKQAAKKSAARPDRARTRRRGRPPCSRIIAEMPEPDRAIGERLHAIIKASADALAETLVRDARVCQGRQGRMLLPKFAEVQNEVRDVRLHARGKPRRRRHVADRLRVKGADRRRRGKDRRARRWDESEASAGGPPFRLARFRTAREWLPGSESRESRSNTKIKSLGPHHWARRSGCSNAANTFRGLNDDTRVVLRSAFELFAWDIFCNFGSHNEKAL